MQDDQRKEVQKIAEAVTREVHAQFTFVQGYMLAYEKLSKEINELKTRLVFETNQRRSR